MEQKRFHIATFGCQMNEYDSTRMEGLLADMGYSPVDDPKAADLILLNTCSVRQRAEHKVYSYVGALRRLKERRPEVIIGVGGCVAQQEGRRLLDQLPHLDLVFGTEAIDDLPNLLADAAHGRRAWHTPRGRSQSEPPLRLPVSPGLKAHVTIMRGCDNFCSYCVVPYVRGREQSRRAQQVLAEVAGLVARGVREVTLLGQNVNSYQDPQHGWGFGRLLCEVAAIPDLWRVRFTTSHPKDLSPELIEVMASEPKVMEQLHLPVQSGSDRILKSMGRGYSRSQYLAKVADLRARLPQVALGSDVIVGFPGEGEADFNDTLSLLAEVEFDFLFSFKYSDRPFTKASRRVHKLPEGLKARRLHRLQELQRQISLKLHRRLKGSRAQVLVEGPARRGRDLMSGRSREGRAVNFPAPPSLAGSLVEVEVVEGLVNSLRGRLVGSAEEDGA